MVHGNTAGVLIAFVANGRGFGAIFEDFGFDDPVDLARGLTREHMIRDLVKNTRCDLACVMHAREIRLLVDRNTVACFASLEDHKGAPKVFVAPYLGFSDGKDQRGYFRNGKGRPSVIV